MILWLILFLLVLAISFVLALSSMKDYRESMPKIQEEYALFLIRKTGNLNTALLNSLKDRIFGSNLVISIERLFKGRRAALAIFGPKTILEQYFSELDLLELEDYSLNFTEEDMHFWEIGSTDLKSDKDFLLKHIPDLLEEDQFLWQIVLGGEKDGFRNQLRAALFCTDSVRRDKLALDFEKLSEDCIAYTESSFKEQIISFWKLRNLNKQKGAHVLQSEKVVDFIRL